MKIAVYPGTFDPITLGHLDIIRRGAHLVDKLVIGVTTNPSKEPMFRVAERLAMVQREVAGIPGNIEVVEFDSLLMDFAEAQGATAILRGLRAVADFEYEFQMAGMNQQLNDDIETVFLMADVSLQPIASKLVKEIARYGGDIDKFVTPAVAADVRTPFERPLTSGVSRAAGLVARRLLGEGFECSIRPCSRCRLLALHWLPRQLAAPATRRSRCRASIAAGRGRRQSRQQADPASCRTAARSSSSCAPTSRRNHVERIQALVRRGFYNGLIFHRVDPRLHGPGRRPQGHRRGRLGAARPQGRVHRHAVPARNGRRGARGRHRTRPTASSSSCSRPNAELDNKYTVIGRVDLGHGRGRQDRAGRAAGASRPKL